MSIPPQTMAFPFIPQLPVTPPPETQMLQKSQPQQTSLPNVASKGMGSGFEIRTDTSAPVARPTLQTATEAKASLPHDPVAAEAAAARDPRYRYLASQLAARYQQQCLAVASFQQQRCQAWQNMYQEKCREMMGKVTLVMAWYIRDRIVQRRKRHRRKFRQGLNERSANPNKVTKTESIRRWAMRVPKDALAPNLPRAEKPADKKEADFDVDRNASVEKDAQLFSVADNLIKRHQGKIEVPLLGTLSLDESDSETEADKTESITWADKPDLEIDEEEYLDEDEDEDEYEDYSDDESIEDGEEVDTNKAQQRTSDVPKP